MLFRMIIEDFVKGVYLHIMKYTREHQIGSKICRPKRFPYR